MKRSVARGVAVLLLIGVASCGKGYPVATAPGFVRIDRAAIEPYDWRAVAPDGVVVALRVIELDQIADLSLWAHAVTIRLQEAGGYVLLVRDDVRSRDQTPGVELVFAHDEGITPFLYRVRLFIGAGRLYVLEAGGPKEQMDRYRPSVDWMLGSVRIG